MSASALAYIGLQLSRKIKVDKVGRSRQRLMRAKKMSQTMPLRGGGGHAAGRRLRRSDIARRHLDSVLTTADPCIGKMSSFRHLQTHYRCTLTSASLHGRPKHAISIAQLPLHRPRPSVSLSTATRPFRRPLVLAQKRLSSSWPASGPRKALINDIPNQEILLELDSGEAARYPSFWLRDHCLCETCAHPHTHQRQLDTFALSPQACKAWVRDTSPPDWGRYDRCATGRFSLISSLSGTESISRWYCEGGVSSAR